MVWLFEFKNEWQEHRKPIDDFLIRNYFVQLDWANREMVYIILTDKEYNIIGVSAMAPRGEGRIHVQVIAIDREWRRMGLGTEILKHISTMYSDAEVTLCVKFSELRVLGFYCGKKLAKIKSFDSANQVVYLSLRHARILHEIPLPD